MSDLRVVSVDSQTHEVVLSTGEIVIAKYEKLRTLCEQLAQEGCPVRLRTVLVKSYRRKTAMETELVEIHREAEWLEMMHARRIAAHREASDVF